MIVFFQSVKRMADTSVLETIRYGFSLIRPLHGLARLMSLPQH